ncbi:MAG: RNA 2'-phosphotransferase [Candidatus Nanoarchaeia archaeon]|nr:RNA 2'-phosphotransferase [Candidatus Nanoarchaeia archaeon]
MNNKDISKKMSYLLRHNPKDLKIESDGYVKSSDLIKKLNISFDKLKEIVDTNDKKRFSFNQDFTKIKANQGHSADLNISVKLKKLNLLEVPDYLYHGTTIDSLKNIKKSGGLKPMNRTHVHLSKDTEIAKNVGLRYAKYLNKLLIFQIDAKKLYLDGNDIFLSENNVYLCNFVNYKYLRIML